MSVFDNQLDPNQLQKEQDKLILANYKISNSGNTLIPRKGSFGMDPEVRAVLSRKIASKIPAGTFKEEHSIFRSIYGSSKNASTEIVGVFENVIREMNLPLLIYNNKRYYQINRDGKRFIAHQMYVLMGIRASPLKVS